MPKWASDSSCGGRDAFEITDGDLVEACLGVEEGAKEVAGGFDEGEEVAGLASLVGASDAENFHCW